MTTEKAERLAAARNLIDWSAEAIANIDRELVEIASDISAYTEEDRVWQWQLKQFLNRQREEEIKFHDLMVRHYQMIRAEQELENTD